MNDTVELKFVGKGPRIVFGRYIENGETRKFTLKQTKQLLKDEPKNWEVIGDLPKAAKGKSKTEKTQTPEQPPLEPPAN